MKNSAAIEILEHRLADMERKGNGLVEIINDLRKEDGLPPRPPFGSGGGGTNVGTASTASLTQIKPDTFYGKKLQTAVREFLDMRYVAAGNRSDPATPKEIYEAIIKGGYQFDTKNDNNAMVGLRSLLRKRTAFFHRLPNGTYGLTSWYPDAKKPKGATATEGDADENGEAEEAEATTASKAAAAS